MIKQTEKKIDLYKGALNYFSANRKRASSDQQLATHRNTRAAPPPAMLSFAATRAAAPTRALLARSMATGSVKCASLRRCRCCCRRGLPRAPRCASSRSTTRAPLALQTPRHLAPPLAATALAQGST